MTDGRRVVTLMATNRVIPARVYIAGVKRAIAEPDREFKTGLDCWWPCTGAEIREQFRAAMHRRISDGIPYNRRGARS